MFSAPATDTNPIEVIFDKTGAVECYWFGGTRYPCDSTALFVNWQTRKKLIPSHFNAHRTDWADQDNLWISINPQSGLASTTEVAPTTGGFLISKSRGFAISAQAMGGK